LATVIDEGAIAKMNGECATTDSTLGFDYQNVSARDGKRPRRV